MRLLAGYRDRSTLEAALLQQGYPVLLSNRVDPFANSNWTQSLPVIETMVEMDIPIAFQTKGGKGIDEVLDMVSPSSWYVSIAVLDDTIRQRIEPGAPTIESRLELLEKLVDRGHAPTVGLNPWVPEWCSIADVEKLLERFKAIGITGVWTEMLHFNHTQLKAMPERGKEAIGQSIINRCKKRSPDQTYFKQHQQVIQLIRDYGMEPFSCGLIGRSNYFKPMQSLYPKTFPVTQDFVNSCFDRTLTPDADHLISFAEFAAFMCGKLPEGVLNIGHYIGATAHNVCREIKGWSNWMSYRDLLRLMWKEPRTKGGPATHSHFAHAVRNDRYILDDEGLPYIVFNPQGFDVYYVEV